MAYIAKPYSPGGHPPYRERRNAESKAWKEENREAMIARRRGAYAANIEREHAYLRGRANAR